MESITKWDVTRFSGVRQNPQTCRATLAAMNTRSKDRIVELKRNRDNSTAVVQEQDVEQAKSPVPTHSKRHHVETPSSKRTRLEDIMIASTPHPPMSKETPASKPRRKSVLETIFSPIFRYLGAGDKARNSPSTPSILGDENGRGRDTETPPSREVLLRNRWKYARHEYPDSIDTNDPLFHEMAEFMRYVPTPSSWCSA